MSALCLHYTVLACLAELEQVRCGLTIQQFSVLMELYPMTLREAFKPSQCTVTSSFIQGLFVPELSLKGSNRRVIEEALIMVWIHFSG